MSDESNDFKDAANAIATERYGADFARGFAHLALQVGFPTFGFTDDQAEEIVTVDRRGDLGCDGIHIAEDEQQVLIFQAKSSPDLSDTELHDYVSSFVSVPSKLASDQWVAKAHGDMKALANEFREAVRNEYQVVYVFATESLISDTVRSTFEDVNEVPGSSIPAFIELLDRAALTSRYRKLLLAEHGRQTDVVFTVRDHQWHQPASEEPVIYLTIPAAEYVRACKPYSMELFRYNPRLYLGTNKVNSSITETLKNDVQRKWFHLLNNGITAVCTQFRVKKRTPGEHEVQVDDFQVVNGCQTTMTLFTNSADVAADPKCLVDLKIIESVGLRDQISNATNTQTAILAEDSFANGPEQRKIADLFKRHTPTYFYAPKRGSWEQLKPAEKRQYQEEDPIFAKYRKVTSKELAAVCLAIFGQPESAKDKPRIVFEKVDGKNSALYERVFEVQNTSHQWILPVEIFGHANALIKAEAAKDPEGDRARIGAYGRYRMLHLAYTYLALQSGEPLNGEADFISTGSSERYLKSAKRWGPRLLTVTLDAVVDSFGDAQAAGQSSGLREFFRESKHQIPVQDRFRKALRQNERLAERNGQTLEEHLGFS